ncbi:hypothetical protein [Plebeiibacterium marinum]|uniref:Uncharacterized protein n=1 Tax=Plebeiibacterium marinum TaxID=2992111 RepID=A0AAE3MH63_9BACT|nr:hypothetical protein [Plebeiobacterium marinum]MCW3807516.1 hypothetical protein [Plebeiobacterium marinum]
MKKTTIILLGIVFMLSVYATSKTLNIYKTDHTVLQFDFNNIDSICVDKSNTQLQVYKKDGNLYTLPLNEIDSMNYSVGDYTPPTLQLISSEYQSSVNKGICEVNISGNGECKLHERGICWSTSEEPTINDNLFAEGTHTGRFYAPMDDLEIGETYHVRAFATNCMGTTYSNSVEMKALPGNVTYTLDIDESVYPEYYNLIKTALDSACYYYNRYTTFKANIYVYYNAGIPTAQASYHGSIGYGPNTTYMWVGTTMHEMAHYFGSGTTTEWKNLMVGGVWQGNTGQQLCQELTGDELHGDNSTSAVHYWPTGINYRSEVSSEQDLINHARVVKAMLLDDAGLPSSW